MVNKEDIPKNFLDCLNCDFSTSTICNWITCEEHEKEFDKLEREIHGK